MGFFDDIAREPDESAMRALPRPSGQVPAPVAIRLMLARTGQVAVAVVGLWAFAAGFDLLVSVELRDEIPGTSVASFLAGLDDEPLEDEFCRLGVQFSTGEKAANTERRPTREGSSGIPGPIMKVRGGGAGLLVRDWRYWVSPLPPPGPLAFVCEWPYFGIAESRTEIDAQPILDAASQSIVLWPGPSDDPRPGLLGSKARPIGAGLGFYATRSSPAQWRATANPSARSIRSTSRCAVASPRCYLPSPACPSWCW